MLRTGTKAREGRAILAFFAAVFVVIGLSPLLSMLWHSFYIDGHWSLHAYKQILSSSYQWKLLAHSLLLASLVTSITLLVGFPLAVLLQKSKLPLRRILTMLFVVPLLLPPYISALAWYYLLGRQGFLAQIFGPQLSEITSSWLFGLPGCVLVLSAAFLPIPMLLSMLALRNIHPEIAQAARLESNWPGIFRFIHLPLMRPALLISAVLVFLLSFGEYGVPNFLHFQVFAVESFVQFSAFYDFAAATAAALPLLAAALLLLFVEAWLNRSPILPLHTAAQTQAKTYIDLGLWQKPLLALLIILAVTTTIGPLLMLLVRAGAWPHYLQALDKAGDSLGRSILYASIAASLMTLLGFALAYLMHHKIGPMWRSFDALGIFLLALPSSVIGIGLIQLWNQPATNFIYATPAIIIIGFLAKYTVLSSRINLAQLSMISTDLEQAAQLAGATWLQSMFYVVTPLAKQGLSVAWIVSYIFAFRDTGIAMLVYPPGHDPLSVRILTLMANGDAAMIAALCLMMVLAVLLPAGLAWVLLRLWQLNKSKK